MNRYELAAEIARLQAEANEAAAHVDAVVAEAEARAKTHREAAQDLIRRAEALRVQRYQTGLSYERRRTTLLGLIKKSAPASLRTFESEIQRRIEEYRRVAPHRTTLVALAELETALHWCRNAATDPAVDDATVRAEWTALRRAVPTIMGYDVKDLIEEVPYD